MTTGIAINPSGPSPRPQPPQENLSKVIARGLQMVGSGATIMIGGIHWNRYEEEKSNGREKAARDLWKSVGQARMELPPRADGSPDVRIYSGRRNHYLQESATNHETSQRAEEVLRLAGQLKENEGVENIFMGITSFTRRPFPGLCKKKMAIVKRENPAQKVHPTPYSAEQLVDEGTGFASASLHIANKRLGATLNKKKENLVQRVRAIPYSTEQLVNEERINEIPSFASISKENSKLEGANTYQNCVEPPQVIASAPVPQTWGSIMFLASLLGASFYTVAVPALEICQEKVRHSLHPIPGIVPREDNVRFTENLTFSKIDQELESITEILKQHNRKDITPVQASILLIKFSRLDKKEVANMLEIDKENVVEL